MSKHVDFQLRYHQRASLPVPFQDKTKLLKPSQPVPGLPNQRGPSLVFYDSGYRRAAALIQAGDTQGKINPIASVSPAPFDVQFATYIKQYRHLQVLSPIH